MRLVMPNRPGMLISVLKAISEANINILGTAGDLRPGEQWGYIHILVDEPEKARQAIEELGVEITSEHEVEILELEDRPGSILEATQPYGKSGHNIEVFYMAHDHLVVGTEAMRKPIPGAKVRDASY
jgi:hypothetical protein